MQLAGIWYLLATPQIGTFDMTLQTDLYWMRGFDNELLRLLCLPLIRFAFGLLDCSLFRIMKASRVPRIAWCNWKRSWGIQRSFLGFASFPMGYKWQQLLIFWGLGYKHNEGRKWSSMVNGKLNGRARLECGKLSQKDRKPLILVPNQG